MLGNWLVLTVALTAADAAKLAQDAILRDLNRLDGTWVCSGGMANGKTISRDNSHHMLNVHGNRQSFELHFHGKSRSGEVSGAIELDPSTSPKQFTAAVDWDLFGTSTIAGIYEIGDDDRPLTACGRAG